MISDCTYYGILELRDSAFFLDTATLLVVVAPAAIVFTLWRIFVTIRTGPRVGVVVLGLDDSSSVYSDMSPSPMPLYVPLLYLGTAVLTFIVGLLASEAWNFLLAMF